MEFWKNYDLFFLVMAAILLIMLVAGIVGVVNNNRGYAMFVFSSIIGIVALFSISLLLQPDRIEAENIVKTEYVGYLNGEEVDLQKIDFSLYKVKYDDENKIVYLTEKNDRSPVFIPFVYH